MHTLVIVNEYSIEGCYSSDDIKIFNCDLTKDELKLWILEKKANYNIKKIEYDRLAQLYHTESMRIFQTSEYKTLVEERHTIQKRRNTRFNNVPKKDRNHIWNAEMEELNLRLHTVEDKLKTYIPSWEYPDSPSTKYNIGDLVIDFRESWDNIAWTVFTLEEFIQRYSSQSITVAFTKA